MAPAPSPFGGDTFDQALARELLAALLRMADDQEKAAEAADAADPYRNSTTAAGHRTTARVLRLSAEKLTSPQDP